MNDFIYRTLLCCGVAIGLAGNSHAVVYAVSTCGDDTRSGIWTSSTGWADAKQTLQAALAVAGPGDSIYLQQGVYSGNFVIPNRVEVYGGFDGTETAFAQRNTKRNTVILDGNGTGPTVRFPAGSLSYTILDGVIVRGGINDWGGGIVAEAGSLAKVNDCIIKENLATNIFRSSRGGGAYVVGTCQFTKCTFYRNQAYGQGYDGSGGAIYFAGGSGPVHNSIFVENLASSTISQQTYGGAIAADTLFSTGTIPIVSCSFMQNQSTNTLGGGTVWVEGNLVDMQNCLFAFSPTGVLFTLGSPGTLTNPLFDSVGLPIVNGSSTGGVTGGSQLAWPLYADVHLSGGSQAVNAGFTFYSLVAPVDYEGQSRGAITQWDIGGDESPLSTSAHLSLSVHANFLPPSISEAHGLPIEIEYLAPFGVIPQRTTGGYLDTVSNFFEEVSVGTLAAGLWDLRIRSHSTLWRRVFSANFTTVGTTRVLAGLYLGDIDGDNIIDLNDYSALSMAYGSCECDPNYLFAADLNRDGCVDIADYAILSLNFGRAGD